MAGTLSAHIRGNAVGYLALFVALGGTSYAATLPRNSVGNTQLKTNAVTSAKIRNGGVRSQDLAPGVVRRGARGPEGPAGAAGAAGAFGGTLPSGKTLRGRWDATKAGAGAVGQTAYDSISFGAQLTAPPTRTIVLAAPGPAQCPGTVADPEAAPGNLCIYVGERINVGTVETLIEGVVTGATTRQGTSVYAVSTDVGSFSARGSWAVTAP